jgi:hypothetical protein
MGLVGAKITVSFRRRPESIFCGHGESGTEMESGLRRNDGGEIGGLGDGCSPAYSVGPKPELARFSL